MGTLYDNKSIFHHTSRFPALLSILSNQAFKIQYCTEKIYLSENTYVHILVPMVSFADIRLTDYVRSFREHTEDGNYALGYYGDYAIGLSKEWAVKKNIIPIIYVPKPKTTLPKNHFLYPLKQHAKRFLKDSDFGKNVTLNSVASFCKHYRGLLEKNVGDKEIYSFHNEQEWRYVPSDLPIKWNYFNSKKDLNYKVQKKKKDILNKKLKRKLEFDLWTDVTHIVVKSDNFIDRVVAVLEKRKQKELKKNPTKAQKIEERFKVLCARIITTSQLCTDL